MGAFHQIVLHVACLGYEAIYGKDILLGWHWAGIVRALKEIT